MSFFRTLSSAALTIILAATMVFAAEEDHTWSLSGDLYADRDTSYIYIGVLNDTLIAGATIEIHYDSTKVSLLGYSKYAINRATGFSVTATPYNNNQYLRLVVFAGEGVNPIATGSGSVFVVPFAVKEGINIGDEVNFYLTDKQSKDTLVTNTAFVVTGTPNQAPVFTDPGSQTAKQGSKFSLQLRATDADGNRLVYRMTTSPGAGASLDSLTGLFTWTPQQSGSAAAVFTVSDGIATATLNVQFTVAAGNVAPVWATAVDSFNLQEGSAFTHTFTRPTDANTGDVVTVSNGRLPGTASFNTTSLILTWTPAHDKAGTHEVVLTASDQAGLKSYHKVYLIVADVNRAPVMSLASGAITAEEGQPVSFTLAASDPDQDELTVTWQITPAVEGATLVNRVFSWREAVAGVYIVRAVVSDPAGLKDMVDVSITVSDVNEAPEFGPVTDVRAEVGQALQVNLTATDPDGDNLTYELVLANATDNILTRGATFANGIFNWSPAAGDAGPNLVTVRVQDPDGLSDEASFTITVIAPNVTAPVSFEAFGTLTVAEGQQIVFRLPLADSTSFDRGAMRFWAEGLPTGAVWNGSTGTVTWTPGLQQAGTYTLNCGVSDGNFEDIQKLTIMVTETDVDPVLATVGNLEVDEGGLLAVALQAVDSSSLEVLHFSAAGLPTGVVLYDLGLLYYKPGYDAGNSYTVTITASDASGNDDSETITLTVNDVNRAPEISADNQAVDEGQTLSFTVVATDPDGDGVALEIDVLPAGASFDGATGSFIWSTTQGQSGNWELEFTGDDGNGGVDSLVVIATIGDVNRPPAIDPVGAVAVREGEQVTITVVASDPDEGDRVTIASGNLPTGATMTQSGTNPVTATIRYTPGYQRQGIFNIKLTATDDAAEPLTVETRLKLEVLDVDVAPSFSGDLAGSGTLNLTVNEGDSLSLRLSATDQGGDQVSVKVSNRPNGARIERGNPDRLVYVPGYDVVGRSNTGEQATRIFNLEVAASDGSQTVTRQVRVTVRDVNRPPRMPNIENQVVTEGDLITFQVNATDPDGDAVQVSTAGRVPYLTAGNPAPARIRDGNVFIFDTSILPQNEIIRSAVFLFWGVDSRGMVSDTVQVEIAIRRSTAVIVPTIIGGGNFPFGSFDGGFLINLFNSLSGSLNGFNFNGTSFSGLINLLLSGGGGGSLLASYAGQEKSKGLYAFTYMAGDLESQFYGIRRGWQLDLSAFSAGTGADSLVPGANVAVSLNYNDEDIPSEIPNFSEDRIKVFGFDAVAQVWVLADSQSVDTTTNTATFKLTNPLLVDYTIGAVLDVVAPVITDVKVSGGGYTVTISDVDTLYSLDGSYQFKANVTDDEVVSSTGVTFYYAVGDGAFSTLAMTRSGVNLFSAQITEGALADGTVIRYYIEARDEMNTVLRPEGAPNEVFQLVVAEYTGKPGDLDGNTTINIFDLLELLKVIGGKQPASIISDVDVNGKTDIFDLLALLKLL